MNIDETVLNYRKNNNGLIEYIQKIVDEKSASGEWDKGVNGQSQNLVTMLIYEYSTSIEKLTQGKITSKQVIDKLSNEMGKLRFGDFKKEVDDNVYYDQNSVTSDEYKKECRIKAKFGAHALKFKDKNGENKSAIVLFDNRQKALIDGKEQELSGIDLQDLSDVRETVFHEWTHVMERCKIKTSRLTKNEIIYQKGNSTYINAMLSPSLKNEQYEEFVSNIDKILKSDTKIPFGGISTIELNPNKCDKRIMHNQISEGATEFIARKVTQNVGDKVKHPERYVSQVKIVGKIFEEKGLSKMISLYFTNPQEIIKDLEQREFKGKDELHYISDCINSNNKKLLKQIKIDKNGSIRESSLAIFFEKIKNKLFKNKTKMLQEGASVKHKSSFSDDEQKFLKRIEVPKEYLETRKHENSKKENDTEKNVDEEKMH